MFENDKYKNSKKKKQLHFKFISISYEKLKKLLTIMSLNLTK